ncbi:MAG: MlaD family protein [Saprospiraceae bacterium]|nr:MlaD family protein [Saprospiraceae bacterium]
MSRETKLGIFAFLVIAGAIWGYNYLKGNNLLSRTQVFSAHYENIGDLMVSSPVKINGFQVGSVTRVYLDENDMRTVVADFTVRQDISIPTKTTAVIVPGGVMGGAAIDLEFKGTCAGADCAQSGAILAGRQVGLIQHMMGGGEIDDYLGKLRDGVSELVDTLTEMSEDGSSNNLVGQSLYDTRQILSNTRVTTAELAIMVERLGTQMQAIMNDLQTVTGTLKSSNQDIAGLLANANTVSKQVVDADLGKTIENSRETLKVVEKTTAELGKATAELKTVLSRIEKGDGTLGKLINEPELYDQLKTTTKNMELLLQDVRLNPKRYINVSVFGKKDKGYDFPAEDPAFVPKK